jgi:N-acetylmuramoyl-L-alanine amidase
MTPSELDVVARTVWGEARGEGRKGMQAVAEVILNRARDPRWPGSPLEVVHQPRQFSAWNEDDPNRARMLLLSLQDPSFRLAYRALLDALEGGNITFGANHYFAAPLAPPQWSRRMIETTQIGRHRFFRAPEAGCP